MPQPLEQVADVHLVGLVVAGERVHHEVDAAAQRDLVLARVARAERVERLAVVVAGPSDLIQPDWPYGIADVPTLHTYLTLMQDNFAGFFAGLVPMMFNPVINHVIAMAKICPQNKCAKAGRAKKLKTAKVPKTRASPAAIVAREAGLATVICVHI